MVHPDIELRFINETVGHGLVARRLIPRGTITWARDRLDRTFTSAEIEAMPEFFQQILDKYTFIDRQGRRVLCWDISRFMNHSCTPSSLHTGWDFEVAVRDIHPGEELTDDYATLNVERPFECECGATGCRGTIFPDDLLRHHARLDAQVRAVFPLVGSVEQPLLHLVEERAAVLRAIEDPRLVPSCLELYPRGLS